MECSQKLPCARVGALVWISVNDFKFNTHNRMKIFIHILEQPSRIVSVTVYLYDKITNILYYTGLWKERNY